MPLAQVPDLVPALRRGDGEAIIAGLAMNATTRREFAFSQEDHLTVADIAYREVGILLPETKAQLVYGRLAPRVRPLQLPPLLLAHVARTARPEHR